MNLLQLRQQFRNESGRYDLVGSDGSDSGANFYINAGQRYLDRIETTQKSYAISYREAAIGQYLVKFPFCRAVQEVWAGTTTERWQLEKWELQRLLSTYFLTPQDEQENGAPLYYSPTVIRTPEKDLIGRVGAFVVYADVGLAHYNYNAIAFGPFAEEPTMIEIKGLFYSPELSADDDESFWTVVHPDILLMAAMRQLEIINRNTQGVNDWTNSINMSVVDIEKDFVEETISEVDCMGG
jgi:hypothetical protein